MRVSKSVEKAFQLAFLKLKRRRKGVVVGVTAALIRISPFAAPMCSIVNLRMLLSTRFFGGFTIPLGP